MRPGGIFSPLGAIEVSEEDKQKLRTEYTDLAEQCYKSKISSACQKKLGMIAAVGPGFASTVDACVQGDSESCKNHAIQTATLACSVYSGGTLAPLCAGAANLIVGETWPYVESIVGKTVGYGANAGTWVLETFGIKDTPDFDDTLNPMKAKFVKDWTAAADGFIFRTHSAIMKTRREFGVAGDRVTLTDGRVMSVPEMVRGVLNFHLQQYCTKDGPWLANKEGNTVRYGNCVGRIDVHLADLTPGNREEWFSWAASEVGRGFRRDMERLQLAMQRAIPDVMQHEAQNPDTVAAMKRAAVREAASRISTLNMKVATPDIRKMAGLTLAPVSSSEGSSGRMRLFMLGAAAAIGIGLAVGTKSRRTR